LQIKTRISSSNKPQCQSAANPSLCEAELEGGLDNLTNPVFKTTQQLEETTDKGNTNKTKKLRIMKNKIMGNSIEDNKDDNPPIVDENTVYSPISDPELEEVEKMKDN